MNPNSKKAAPNSGKSFSKGARVEGSQKSRKNSIARIGFSLIFAGFSLGVLAFVWVQAHRIINRDRALAKALAPASATNAAQFPLDATGTNSVSSGTNQAPHEEGENALSDSEIAVGLLTRGNEFLAEGKNEEAIKEYEHSLRHDPGSEDAHYNLAIALAKLGKDDEAILHYKEALRVLPDYAEAHNNLGNLLVKRSKLEEAIEHFNEALNLNQDSASTHNNLGRALALQGKLTDATIHFAKAVQLMPNYVDARCNLGNAYVSQGRLDEAVEEFKEALRLQPNYAPAIRALMKVRQKRSP